MSEIEKQVTGRRKKFVKVKTAKGRKKSSTEWLQRQLNDPYVAAANRMGLRSRAAFKLIELDEKYSFLGRGKNIVDLGAAPGGWTELAVKRNKGQGQVIGIDILEMDDIPGATIIQKDFTEDDAPDILKSLLNGKVDIVMSDMAANTVGHQQTDHLRIMALVEMAYYFAKEVMADNGVFIAKVFQGGAQKDLLDDMKRSFTKVGHFKPKSSRKGSPETYVVATGFKAKV